MHPPRHLEDLVGTEVEPLEHIAAPLHHVAVAGVVDHHRVEPAHVEADWPAAVIASRKGFGDPPRGIGG